MDDLNHLAISLNTPEESHTEKENNQTIVIFGGTGSIGTVLAEGFLKESVNTLVLVSNNEHELWKAKNKFKEWDFVSYVFCDVRDKEEVEKIFMRFHPNIVINCAALKHVNYCEEFPINTIKTNILGLENLLHSSNLTFTQTFLQISTDKACYPINIMGASKLIGERLCMQWNNASDYTDISCVRFGNVLGSRGSLLPQIKRDIEKYKKVFITDRDMERYVITKDEVWKFVKLVIERMKGGEIFVPKLKKVYIIDMITEIVKNYKDAIEIITIGKGKTEKLQEILYTKEEEEFMIEKEDYYIIKG